LNFWNRKPNESDHWNKKPEILKKKYSREEQVEEEDEI
jgi:hypothetical protein